MLCFKGINFTGTQTSSFAEKRKAKSNAASDESLTVLRCTPESVLPGLDDEICIKEQNFFDGTEYLIYFDSDSDVPIFRSGMVDFYYNNKSHQYKMSTEFYSDRQLIDIPVKDPGAVVDIVTQALRCYAISDQAREEGVADKVMDLANKILLNKESIISTAFKNTVDDEIDKRYEEREQHFREAMHFFGG